MPSMERESMGEKKKQCYERKPAVFAVGCVTDFLGVLPCFVHYLIQNSKTAEINTVHTSSPCHPTAFCSLFSSFSLLSPSGVTGGLQGQALQAVGVHQGVLTVCKQKHGCLQSCKAQRREGGCPSTFFSSLSITTSQCNPRSQISKLKGKKKMLEK